MSDTARLWGWLCATVGEHPPPHRPPFPRPVRVNKREGIESQPGPPSPPSSRPPTHFYRGLVEYLSPSLHTKTGTFHFLFPGEYRPTVVRIPQRRHGYPGKPTSEKMSPKFSRHRTFSLWPSTPGKRFVCRTQNETKSSATSPAVLSLSWQ